MRYHFTDLQLLSSHNACQLRCHFRRCVLSLIEIKNIFRDASFCSRKIPCFLRDGVPARSSFLSRWSMAIHIYVRAIRILAINSTKGQRIVFPRTVKIFEKEPKGNSGIRWKVQCFGEHASEFSGSSPLLP